MVHSRQGLGGTWLNWDDYSPSVSDTGVWSGGYPGVNIIQGGYYCSESTSFSGNNPTNGPEVVTLNLGLAVRIDLVLAACSLFSARCCDSSAPPSSGSLASCRVGSKANCTEVSPFARSSRQAEFDRFRLRQVDGSGKLPTELLMLA